MRVSRHRLIKGPCNPPEVEATQYIAKHATISVRKVYAIHSTRNQLIDIEMEYVQDDDLDTAWRAAGRLTRDQKKASSADIKEYICILRELQPPAENLVASALPNPAYDGLVGSRFFGPSDHHDFHSLTRGHLRMEDVALAFGEEVAKVHNTPYRTCFAHGDMVARNIIVRDGRVAAIIDWDFAGWYPEYREFNKAHYDFFPGEDWLDYVREAPHPYDTELIAGQPLWELLADPDTPATLYRDGVTREKPGPKPSAAWLDARAGRQLNDLWPIALSSRRLSSGT